VPLEVIGLWLGLSLVLVLVSAVPDCLTRYRWALLALVVVALGGALALAWTSPVETLARWRSGLAFDSLAKLLLPPLWTGAAGAMAVAIFLPSGRYEPAIAALSTTAATAGILSGNPLLVIVLLLAIALVILAGLLVHDEGLMGHPMLNVATGIKYLILNVVATACLVMALLLSNFYSLNPDRTELVRIVAAVFVVGFGLAAGAMPFYFHIPDTFDATPSLATVSLAGPLQCLAVVYLIRTTANGPWLLTDPHVSDVLMAGAIAGALLAGIMAFGQRRLNRLLAFNAMRELGWIGFGIASVSRGGWRGALILLAVRCVSQPLLIVIAKLVQARRGEADLEKLGGLAKLLPLTTFAWCAGVFASVGLPPAASFWGLGSLLGFAWSNSRLTAILLGLSGVLALWRLAQASYGTFWRPSAAIADVLPERPTPSWVLACLGLGLGFAGVAPRVFQAPLDQVLAYFPFLR